MSDQDENQPMRAAKTFVRGSYLYMEDGEGYREKHKQPNQKESERVIKDTLGIYQYQKELKQKKMDADSKRRQHGGKPGDRPTLIPIRDTPVEPIPEPVLTYQKCERATQQQFEYFQSYIKLKEKQKQFQDEENQQINNFIEKQRRVKEKQAQNPASSIFQLVMEKDEEKPMKKTKKIVKITIKKKQKVSQ